MTGSQYGLLKEFNEVLDLSDWDVHLVLGFLVIFQSLTMLAVLNHHSTIQPAHRMIENGALLLSAWLMFRPFTKAFVRLVARRMPRLFGVTSS